jgi:hypothetical protein
VPDRPIVIALTAAACLVAASTAEAALTQIPVKATPLRETVPGAGGTYIA